MSIQIEDLPWLLPAPDDFRDQCAELKSATDLSATDLSAAVQALALRKLTLNQATRLAGVLDDLPDWQARLQSAGMAHYRLGIASNCTFDLIVPAIVAAGLRHGVVIDCVISDFDQAVQQSLDPDSLLNQSQLDAILIALDYRAFDFGTGAVMHANSDTTGATGFAQLEQIRGGFAQHSSTPCIVQTLAAPPGWLLGHIDGQLSGSLRSEIADFNRQLHTSVAESTDTLLDIAALVESVGSDRWFDDRGWYSAKFPLADRLVPLYADHVARQIAAQRGKSGKCLVLDLDNTLWAGVIGDDGLDGIVIGQGTALGEAHLAVQRYADELRRNGVVLAVCSKNDEPNAKLPFQEHPDMLLKLDDIAVFVANWSDKASNLRAIASTLNIGLDALVFLDDNPAERDLVRTFAPQVRVPELPADATGYTRTLAAAGYFEQTSFTAEDAQRSSQYAANASREKALESAVNIEEYLEALAMTITFAPFDSVGRKRITQLINKTNQFNLTTQRYSEAQVAEFEQSDDWFTLQVRLVDKFGDNGMICVVLCRIDGTVWDIDTWLMSCRVIKRQVEQAVCDELVRAARKHGATEIRGNFQSTAKNSMVENLFPDLGFAEIPAERFEKSWSLRVAEYAEFAPPMEIERPDNH